MDQSKVSAQVFVEQVYGIGSWRGELAPPTTLSLGAARAMTRLVLAQPAIAIGRRADMQLRLFGPTDDDGLQALRAHSVGFMVAGALALGMTGQPLKDVVLGLVHASADIDPDSLLLRAQLLREYPFAPPVPLIPDWLDPRDRFTGADCYAAVVKAVLELGRWADSGWTTDATGIGSMSASTVCPGALLEIYGVAFPDPQPPDTRVYVPTRNGGCREAAVESWSNSRIAVRIPVDIGPGCVGFVRGSGTFQEPQQVTGALTACIGAAAEAWTRGFKRVNSPLVSCPPCLPGGQNHIDIAGAPQINTFRFTPQHVEPGGQPILSWEVRYANQVLINGVSASGSLLNLPGLVPLIGSLSFGAITGTVPSTGVYRLTASNVCGVTVAQTQFTMSRTPSLSVTRIEVIQSIQKVDNSVRLVASRRTAVRVFVDSGITDGFDVGVGPNRVSGIKATLFAENLATGGITSCGASWTPNGIAGPTLNRNVLDDSLNFDVPLSACTGNVRFRATVEIPGPPGVPPSAFATGSTDVTFTPKPPQALLPLLYADPSSTSPTPTMADFFATLQGPARMQPFPENGFTVNPPIPLLLGPGALTNDISWFTATMNLAIAPFLFSSTPVGGLRVGIIPNDGRYTRCGWSFRGGFLSTTSFLVKAGDTDCCAHELGHCFGLDHVNCGGPAGPYDGGLPLTLSDPGLDITARKLFPTGSNESMTYCSSPWVSAEHWDRVFDRIPI